MTRKPAAWDCTAYDGGRYLIRAVEGAKPLGWPSCEPLYAACDVSKERDEALEEAATIADEAGIRAAARRDSKDAKTASGTAILTGYIFAATEARSIAESIRALKGSNAQTGIMMSPTEMILTQDENSLIGLVMRLTGGSTNPDIIKGQIERIRKEKACETTSSPS